MARNYSNIALDTTLVAGIGAGDPTCTVVSAAGYPAALFAIVIDPGLATEEVCQVTIKAGAVFTITRGFDGTTAAAHAIGATVRHSAIAGDFTDLQAADATNAAAIVAEAGTRAAADALLAPIASPTFTFVPAAPTAAPGTNTTQIATTAFVLANSGGSLADGRALYGATTVLTIPGIDFIGVATQLQAVDTLRYSPMFVTTPITLDRIGLEVTGAAAAGTVIRLGIYNADLNWQPTTLVLDAGTVAADSLGQKLITINQALPAGRYLLVSNTDGAPTLRTVTGGQRFMGINALGGAPMNVKMTVASAYGVLAGAGVAWDTGQNLSSAFIHSVVVRVSVP